MNRLTVYGAPWCPDCRRVKKFLGEQRIGFDWVDVDESAEGLRTIQAVQNGGRTIPTVVFAQDGEALVNPASEELARRLGLTIEAARPMYDLAIAGGGP